jgi:hypothetical protein
LSAEPNLSHGNAIQLLFAIHMQVAQLYSAEPTAQLLPAGRLASASKQKSYIIFGHDTLSDYMCCVP